MPDLDLFGDEIAAPAAPYHLLDPKDRDAHGCDDCRHCRDDKPAKAPGGPTWRCPIQRREVDTWLGTCGRWEGEE